MSSCSSPARRGHRALRWSALAACAAALAGSAVVATSPEASAAGPVFNITAPAAAGSCLTGGPAGSQVSLQLCAPGRVQGLRWYNDVPNTRLTFGSLCFAAGRPGTAPVGRVYPVQLQPCNPVDRSQKVTFTTGRTLVFDDLGGYCSTVDGANKLWLIPCRSGWASRQQFAVSLV